MQIRKVQRSSKYARGFFRTKILMYLYDGALEEIKLIIVHGKYFKLLDNAIRMNMTHLESVMKVKKSMFITIKTLLR